MMNQRSQHKTGLWLVREIHGDYQLFFGKPRYAAGDWTGGVLITTWPQSSFQREFPELLMGMGDQPRRVRLAPV